MSSADAPVAVIGGGVLGAAVAYALARRGVGALLLESEDELALRASGTNSGILHTGFDSKPGKLETRLILRSGQLRPHVFRELGLPVIRCGAVLRPVGSGQRKIVAALARDARRNGVEVVAGDGGTLAVPGESVTDPVAYTLALARAATAGGGEVRTEARVEAVKRAGGRLALSLAGGGSVTCDAPSTAPGCTRTRWRARRATTASRSTRARASSSCSTPREGTRSNASCFRCRRGARRGCWCCRPSTAA